MEIINTLLETIPDKPQHLTTTSHKFKKDIWEYFSDDKFKQSTAVEFGTHKGQTTRILSYLFDKVYTINCNDNASSKELNADRNNIVHMNFDLYSNKKLVINDQIDFVLIDAGHLYENVIMDINRATSLNCNPECYLVFDDYGCNVHRSTVRVAVDKALDMEIITKVCDAGHSTGYNFGNGGNGGIDRILEGPEGLITKINWQ